MLMRKETSTGTMTQTVSATRKESKMNLLERLKLEEKKSLTEEEREERTLKYVEEFGIVDYKRKPNDNRLIFYKNSHGSLAEPKVTYKHIVRLNTMTEEVQKLNKYYPKGNVN